MPGRDGRTATVARCGAVGMSWIYFLVRARIGGLISEGMVPSRAARFSPSPAPAWFPPTSTRRWRSVGSRALPGAPGLMPHCSGGRRRATMPYNVRRMRRPRLGRVGASRLRGPCRRARRPCTGLCGSARIGTIGSRAVWLVVVAACETLMVRNDPIGGCGGSGGAGCSGAALGGAAGDRDGVRNADGAQRPYTRPCGSAGAGCSGARAGWRGW